VNSTVVTEYTSVRLECSLDQEYRGVKYFRNNLFDSSLALQDGNCNNDVDSSIYDAQCISTTIYAIVIRNVTRALHETLWQCRAVPVSGSDIPSNCITLQVKGLHTFVSTTTIVGKYFFMVEQISR